MGHLDDMPNRQLYGKRYAVTEDVSDLAASKCWQRALRDNLTPPCQLLDVPVAGEETDFRSTQFLQPNKG